MNITAWRRSMAARAACSTGCSSIKLRTSQPTPTRPNGVPMFFMMPDAQRLRPRSIPKSTTARTRRSSSSDSAPAREESRAGRRTTPTPAMRRRQFQLSRRDRQSDLRSGHHAQNANGTWARDPFPGTLIPLNRFDPVARKVLEFDPWVSPNRRGGFNIHRAPSATIWPTSSPKCSSTTTISAWTTSSTRISRSTVAGPTTSQSGLQRPMQHPCQTGPIRSRGQGNFAPFAVTS